MRAKEDPAILRKLLDASRGLRDAVADQSGIQPLLRCRESDAVYWLFGTGSTSSARDTAARAESASASARVGNVREDRATSEPSASRTIAQTKVFLSGPHRAIRT